MSPLLRLEMRSQRIIGVDRRGLHASTATPLQILYACKERGSPLRLWQFRWVGHEPLYVGLVGMSVKMAQQETQITTGILLNDGHHLRQQTQHRIEPIVQLAEPVQINAVCQRGCMNQQCKHLA